MSLTPHLSRNAILVLGDLVSKCKYFLVFTESIPHMPNINDLAVHFVTHSVAKISGLRLHSIIKSNYFNKFKYTNKVHSTLI